MPVYEYRCENQDCELWNIHQEELKSLSDRDLAVLCGACGDILQKLVSASFGRVQGGASHIPVSRNKK